jgi:hypothetical protein
MRRANQMKENTMNNVTKCSVAIAIAGATTLGVASPSWAAPVLSNTVAVKAAVPSATTDVRYYRRGFRNHGGLILGGLALGAVGAVAAQGYYRDRPYGAYGYGEPYRGRYVYGPAYGQPYGYAPAYGYGGW